MTYLRCAAGSGHFSGRLIKMQSVAHLPPAPLDGSKARQPRCQAESHKFLILIPNAKTKMFKTQFTYCWDFCKLLLLDVLLLEMETFDARTGFFVPGCALAILQLGGCGGPT